MKDQSIRGFSADDFERTARLLRSGGAGFVIATLSNNIARDDFEHTARLLRSGGAGFVIATLSNNINIILAALDTAPDLYEALAPLKRGAEEADYVADDHTVLIGISIAELRAAQAALAKASPPSASEEGTT